MASTQQPDNLQNYFTGVPLVTKLLLGINCTIYLMSLIASGNFIQNESLSVASIMAPMHEVSRMITYPFIHASFLHILMNMMALLQLGSALEKQFGSLPFLILTALALIIIPLLYLLLEWCAYIVTNSTTYLYHSTVGFSGVLFTYAVVEAFHEPMPSRIVCGVEIPSYVYPFLVLGVLQVLVPGVSFVGHVSGVLVGLLIVCGICKFCFPSHACISDFESPGSCVHVLSSSSSYVRVCLGQSEGFVAITFAVCSPESSCFYQSLGGMRDRFTGMCHRMKNCFSSPSNQYEEILATETPILTTISSGSVAMCGDGSGGSNRGSGTRECVDVETQQKNIRAIRLAKFATDP